MLARKEDLIRSCNRRSPRSLSRLFLQRLHHQGILLPLVAHERVDPRSRPSLWPGLALLRFKLLIRLLRLRMGLSSEQFPDEGLGHT